MPETPHDLLEAIHRCLYPERWKDCNPDWLNAEGLYEWRVEDLEIIGMIIRKAEDLGHVIPTNPTEGKES